MCVYVCCTHIHDHDSWRLSSNTEDLNSTVQTTTLNVNGETFLLKGR